MKSVVRRPARRRSATRIARRNKRGVSSPLSVSLGKVSLPKVGARRNGMLVAIAFLGVLALSLLGLPVYAVSDIEVVGNQGTATADIQEAAGFVLGRNAFLVRSRDVEAAVEELSGVVSAEASVSLPGRVRITVTDTRPDVAWLSNGILYLVDRNGTIREQGNSDPAKMLRIRDMSGRLYQKGDKVDERAVQAALNLALILPREIQDFEWQRANELSVISGQGWRALFDTRDDLNVQVDALRRVLSSGRNATAIDVRVPSMPAYR
jgi:cell division septal protein FtsQ